MPEQPPSLPPPYVRRIATLVRCVREDLQAGGRVSACALVGRLDGQALEALPIDSHSAQAKEMSGARIRACAAQMQADFVLTLMEAWALDAAHAHEYETIMQRYGSIGASPDAQDIVAFMLETPQGSWSAQARVRALADGVGRTFDEPQFVWVEHAEGRFVGLLPARGVAH